MKSVRKIKTILAVSLAALFVLCTGGAATAASDELTSYDKTSIEEDLRDIDVSSYIKDENAQHRLMDEVGFVEYGYSESSMIATNYYGIYFYVYNPTEKEVSTRPGANVVNMAISYNEKGEPADYANLALTILDHTENHRFYKFRLTDSASVYTRAKAYAAAHDGARRYDIASVQLWFAGEQNATDENPDARTQMGYTYTCTGYAAGCGGMIKTSTLKVDGKNLETVSLDVKHTFYRTKTSNTGASFQKQIDTVYFSVPKRYIEAYGKLQRIKAEWYEYKTSPIAVTSSSDFYYAALPYVGIDMTLSEQGFNQDFGYTLYPSAVMDDGGWLGHVHEISEGTTGWNAPQTPTITALYYLFHTRDWCSIENYDPYSDIEEIGGVSSNALEQYILNYNKTYEKGMIQIGDKVLSADLFENDIDENRKCETEYGKIQMGYSFYDFDVDTVLQEILTYNADDHSFLDNWKMYGFWKALFHLTDEEEAETLSPILILTKADLAGTDEEISSRLKVHINDVSEIKKEFNDAVTVESEDDEEKVVVLFRFAVSDYYSQTASFSKITIEDGKVNLDCSGGHGKAYFAQESVFLDFDIIQLTFNNEGSLTVVPVVANPIDIIDAITPPWTPQSEDFWTIVWILLGVIGVQITLLIGIKIYEKHKDKS